MDLVVTVDTEADDQWHHGKPVSCRNVEYWAAFQRLCETYGVFPTYLITSEMAEDRRGAELLATWAGEGHAEVGAHLHSWTTAPFVDAPGMRYNDPIHIFESALPDRVLRAKLESLTAQIVDNVGVRPLAYRAGRFGMALSTARILAELGYVVDSSVTPLLSWADESSEVNRGQGPDFRHLSAAPFTIAGSGEPGILELPVTIVVGNRLARSHDLLARAYLSHAARVPRRLLRRGRPEPIWLRPFPHQTAGDLECAWRIAKELGLPCAVMMFHSSELMPGGSPHRPTRRSVTDLLAVLDQFFRHVVKDGGTPATLSGSARRISKASTPQRSAL